MLTNLENQLREQNATEKLDEVLEEIPKVREELGFIPLVTPTSQIVGTQAVINVLMGERYKTITKETAGVLKGEYGSTIAPVDADLQSKVLEGSEPITCRPADLLEPEVESLSAELKGLAKNKFELAKDEIDDVLTYALFPQIGLKFLENRGNSDAFEPAPGSAAEPSVPEPSAQKTVVATAETTVYQVRVNGNPYTVEIAEGGELSATPAAAPPTPPSPTTGGQSLPAPLAGNVFKVLVSPGQAVAAGETVIVLEAMKMETEVSAPAAGTVASVDVAPGDAVAVGDSLLTLN